jgi:hypothetical protein
MRRREDGATTVLIAVVAVIIFAMAAVAVDLTNAYSRKRDIQTDADFAALAASQEDTFPADTQPAAGDPVVTMVADYIVENFPQDDLCSNWGGDNRANCDSEATMRLNLANNILTDGDWKNGEVAYGKFTTDATIGIPTDLAAPRDYFDEDPLFLTVVTPRAQVDFGFAGIFGPGAPSKTKVYASATVALRSPGEGVMPVYAVSGCDYGRQTITDPAGGHVEPVPVPPLLFDTDTNNARLTAPTTTAPNPLPDQVSVNAATTAVTILGSQLLNTTQDAAKGTPGIPDEVSVGYFLPASSPGGPLLVERPIKLTPLFAGDPVSTNNALISDIPTSVSAVEGVWYVRVKQYVNPPGPTPLSYQWSARDEAIPLRVGEAVLECNAGSNDGNFGTLRLPRNDGPTSDDLPMNIADALQFTLAIYPGSDPPYECTNLGSPAVHVPDENTLPTSTNAPPVETGTNCVPTDPGLPANVATQGLIEGVGSVPGRLDADTTEGCDPDGNSDRVDSDVRISPSQGDYMINNDVITCFFLDDTTTLSQIVDPAYSGDPLISKDIFKSPRFYWLPVLKDEPISGASNEYSIIDFRPAFITDMELASTKQVRIMGPTNNGLTVEHNNITTMKVVFFNVLALPRTVEGGPTTPYLGIGPKVLQLID